jgi:DNA helicase-2/ATP-dependent DNA helicase PcrA
MEEYETLGAFLEHVSLVMDNENAADEDKVTMMTVHAAKGLEFDTVFLAGWEEGVFPSQRALDEGGQASLEEERRLAYVAITRARRKCFILHAANRRIYGQWTSSIPSRFVAELPPANVAQESTMTGGESLWRANWSEYADPFANVGRSGTRGPGWQRAASGYQPSYPSPLAGEGGARSAQPSGRERGSAEGTYQSFADRAAASTEAFRAAQAASRGATTRVLPVESRASAVSLGNPGRSDLELGQRVFHQKFGYGVIAAIEGNKLEIDFEQAGRKRVLDSFVSVG